MLLVFCIILLVNMIGRMRDSIGMSMIWIDQEAIIVEKVVVDRQMGSIYKMRR